MRSRTRLRFLIGIFLGIQWQDLSNLWSYFRRILLLRFEFFDFGKLDHEAPFHFWQPAILKRNFTKRFSPDWVFILCATTRYLQTIKRCIFLKVQIHFVRRLSILPTFFLMFRLFTFNDKFQGLVIDMALENNVRFGTFLQETVPFFYYLEAWITFK